MYILFIYRLEYLYDQHWYWNVRKLSCNRGLTVSQACRFKKCGINETTSSNRQTESILMTTSSLFGWYAIYSDLSSSPLSLSRHDFSVFCRRVLVTFIVLFSRYQAEKLKKSTCGAKRYSKQKIIIKLQIHKPGWHWIPCLNASRQIYITSTRILQGRPDMFDFISLWTSGMSVLRCPVMSFSHVMLCNPRGYSNEVLNEAQCELVPIQIYFGTVS